jgi:TolB-like protein/tetratricopeptide (TPR) repeat protein
MTPIRAGTIFIIVILAGWFWQTWQPDSTEPFSPTGIQYIDSVAVMPLADLTGNSNLTGAGASIANEITTHLSRIPALKVISHHSARAVANEGLTLAELGNALNVRHVINGTIEVDGDGLRIVLSQVNTSSGNSAWSERFSTTVNGINEIQEDISLTVTDHLVAVTPGLAAPEYSEHTDAGPGYAAYLSGLQWVGERTPDGLRNAITELQKAINLDPGFAPAYAELSSAYALSVFYRYEVGVDSYSLAARSLAFADHAIALDADLAAGYAARGYLGALLGRSADAVAADFDRAAELQPNAASIPSWRARSLAQLGQYEEAFAEASRAIDLDPLAPGRHIALAELSLQLGRLDQAIASAKMATALAPGIVRSRAIEARALLLDGNPQRCASMQLGPHRILRATCLKLSGQAEEADEIIEQTLADIRESRLRTNGTTDVAIFEDLAVYYAFRGDPENALFWSAKAYAASPVGLEIRVLESQLFDKVRDDPKFSTSIAGIRADIFDRVRRDSERFR